jgi:hypothetical protein
MMRLTIESPSRTHGRDSWVRQSGKSVKQIAAAYAEIVKRDQDWKP